jgi:hypothetical protein
VEAPSLIKSHRWIDQRQNPDISRRSNGFVADNMPIVPPFRPKTEKFSCVANNE